MDWLDPVLLGRIQFTLTAVYHFIFVPLSIGIGLIMAIFETKAFRSGSEKDAAAARFWVKLFTVTFAVGVATGITMEFSFGTNWADYSRFVGDIFGAPLAAEALLAFFLESVFLGVLLFGRGRVGKKFYLASAWLVWFGSCLSALWILIANSWMQTPAGAELAADGSRAVITDFLAAAFNPSTLPRYGHTVTALLVMGAFVAMAIGGYYLLKKRHQDFAMKAVKIGSIVGIVATCGLLVFAHSSAVEVAEEQPTKLAMMEGMYDSEVPPLYAFGWVDEESQEVLSPIAIPGGTSFLATGTWDTEYMGLNELAETEQYADLSVEDLPVNLVFQSYHLMVMLFGLILITVVLALIFQRGGKLKDKRWLQRLLFVSPLFPFFAIVTGWVTAEIGRQPWVVYPSTSGPEGVSLLTSDAISQSVSSVEVLVTIVLFTLIYLFIFVAYVRIVAHFIKKGPDDGEAVAPAADAKATSGAAAVAAAGAAKDGE
ncbi:MAG TPA: cytochrome ubiquinol oxidase subunit I [Candidatus Aphodovivens avicola]|nr:cytochrome ubiquinol oxidase subunit I [Candidatus Aphodovivens avicola]